MHRSAGRALGFLALAHFAVTRRVGFSERRGDQAMLVVADARRSTRPRAPHPPRKLAEKKTDDAKYKPMLTSGVCNPQTHTHPQALTPTLPAAAAAFTDEVVHLRSERGEIIVAKPGQTE